MGWGAEVFDPDTEWVTAKHDLDGLIGNPHVSFRVALDRMGHRVLETRDLLLTM